jgi:hypothetical protein
LYESAEAKNGVVAGDGALEGKIVGGWSRAAVTNACRYRLASRG